MNGVISKLITAVELLNADNTFVVSKLLFKSLFEITVERLFTIHLHFIKVDNSNYTTQ